MQTWNYYGMEHRRGNYGKQKLQIIPDNSINISDMFQINLGEWKSASLLRKRGTRMRRPRESTGRTVRETCAKLTVIECLRDQCAI